jgi:hypothetical protein
MNSNAFPGSDGEAANKFNRRDVPRAGLAAALVAPTSLGFVADATAVQDEAAVSPFKVTVPESDIVDLRERLSRVRWPSAETVGNESQGVPQARMKALVDFWQKHYDWRRFERQINQLPQFSTTIDGLGIHFIHVRSKHPDAAPLLLTHGWPGSVIEFMKVVGPLTDPTSHGGKAEDALHVVIPSLPGFGFSEKPTAPGWGMGRIA